MGKRFRKFIEQHAPKPEAAGVLTATLMIDLNAPQQYTLRFDRDDVNGALVLQALSSLRDDLLIRLAVARLQQQSPAAPPTPAAQPAHAAPIHP